MSIAKGSYNWYRSAAIRSRRWYRLSETAVLIVSAAIPATAAIIPHNAIPPAVLGAIVVILSGLRAIFHWQDNYLRFSGAREAVEAERRLYNTGADPYADPATRDQVLAAAISRIEQAEMGGWIRIAAERPKPLTALPSDQPLARFLRRLHSSGTFKRLPVARARGLALCIGGKFLSSFCETIVTRCVG